MKAADLFAGWGGFTLAVEQAGAEVVWAGNHWPLAVEAHALNHPQTVHVCQDLNQANFYAMPDIDLLVAGPSCPGFSQAAQPARKNNPGTRGKHDALRANAWAVVEAAEAKRPQVLLVENVVQFRDWPLFPCWKAALEVLGYAIETHVLLASHCGVPQRRERLFTVGVLGRTPLGLHFEPDEEPGIGPSLDFDLGVWRPVATAPVQVQARIAKARRRGLGDRFLTQHVTGHPGVPLWEPVRTITTKDQWALVRGDEYRPMSVRENARAMGFPDSYRWPARATRKDQVKGLGNAVCPPQGKRLVSAVLERI